VVTEIQKQEKVREALALPPRPYADLNEQSKAIAAAMVEVNEWETERDETRRQLEKVSPLVTALHRIATNDGHGEYGDMWLEEINRIAKDALSEWHIKNLRAATPAPKHG
jgi:hypothetical protein